MVDYNYALKFKQLFCPERLILERTIKEYYYNLSLKVGQRHQAKIQQRTAILPYNLL